MASCCTKITKTILNVFEIILSPLPVVPHDHFDTPCVSISYFLLLNLIAMDFLLGAVLCNVMGLTVYKFEPLGCWWMFTVSREPNVFILNGLL